MVANESYAVEAFRSLLEVHNGCMDAGLPEAGYHALAAAMHCAEATANHEQLRMVVERAELRQRELDAVHPSHQLSTRQASWRAHTPVFASLAITANAILVRLKADAVRAQSMARMR